jgi:hypothetical protein
MLILEPARSEAMKPEILICPDCESRTSHIRMWSHEWGYDSLRCLRCGNFRKVSNEIDSINPTTGDIVRHDS